MSIYSASDLLLDEQGRVYHLKLRPDQVAPNIFLVGDPDRVGRISSHFSSVDSRVQNREFVSHTGTYATMPVSVISTGIGTDNIDIVMNELDALFNIDLETRRPKKKTTSLNIVRIGTSGALQKHIEPGSFALSVKAIGFDGLLNYYEGVENITDRALEKALMDHLEWPDRLPVPYIVDMAPEFSDAFHKPGMHYGLTISAPGFYGPQARTLRLPSRIRGLLKRIDSFEHDNQKIINFEMESSAIYGLAQLLGHRSATLCVIVANRLTNKYLRDYQAAMNELIADCLDRLSNIAG
jgi:uridine phosphorylase